MVAGPIRVTHRPVVVEIDIGAIAENVRTLKAIAGKSELLAVVKADAYGHGAVQVSKAALTAGATWLGVALVEEGIELRVAGIEATIMVLSEPPIDAADDVIAHALTPVAYSSGFIAELGDAARNAGITQSVHLKIDTGMHRVGCAPQEAVTLARQIAAHPGLFFEGVCTHLAVADEPGNSMTDQQLDTFDEVLLELEEQGLRPPIAHAANSAALIAYPRSRYDLVRTGIALYGIAPSPGIAIEIELRPAMTLRAKISHVRDLDGGERISYGQHYELKRRSRIATVPLGYADGVPRKLGEVSAEVLIAGKRYPIAGTITMDQLMIDCGDELISVGDEVVLIGTVYRADSLKVPNDAPTDVPDAVTASEWAALVDTIPYEIVCGIGPRVPRRYIS